MDNCVHPETRRVATEIDTMEIRSAATIADAAARALRTQAMESDAIDVEAFRAEFHVTIRTLHKTRPAAVSLLNALRYVLHDMLGTTVEGPRQSVIDLADELCTRLKRAQVDLGQVGVNRLRDGDTIMTHCHSMDALACVGTTVGQGKHIGAVVKETWPRNQGYITAERFHELGVSVTLIIDSAIRRYLNDVDYVSVGTGAVATGGGAINKIGTSGLVVNTRERGTSIIAAVQTLELHPGTTTGHIVDIKMRDTAEVVDSDTFADLGSLTVKNPVFDVTPPRYVDTIITECGQFLPESIVILMRELFGEGTSELWMKSSPQAEP